MPKWFSQVNFNVKKRTLRELCVPNCLPIGNQSNLKWQKSYICKVARKTLLSKDVNWLQNGSHVLNNLLEFGKKVLTIID